MPKDKSCHEVVTKNFYLWCFSQTPLKYGLLIFVCCDCIKVICLNVAILHIIINNGLTIFGHQKSFRSLTFHLRAIVQLHNIIYCKGWLILIDSFSVKCISHWGLYTYTSVQCRKFNIVGYSYGRTVYLSMETGAVASYYCLDLVLYSVHKWKYCKDIIWGFL
jgi:hypothetical protein